MRKAYERPVHDLSNNYNELADILKQDDHIIITNNGEKDSVLISIDEYHQYEEFLHEKFVKETLANSRIAASKPDAKWYSMEDFQKFIENVSD